MIMQLIDLEEKISKNCNYLKKLYPQTDLLLEQIQMILDHGISPKERQEWFERNRVAIGIVEEFLDDRLYS